MAVTLPLLKGETQFVPAPGMKKSLNADVPLRRTWNPGGEWKEIILRHEYNDAFFYHGSQGALSAVRWRNWKMYLNPSLELYDLSADPGESQLVRNRDMVRKLRGMAILFQEEMQADARPPGHANDLSKTEPDTEVSNPSRSASCQARLELCQIRGSHFGDGPLSTQGFMGGFASDPLHTWGRMGQGESKELPKNRPIARASWISDRRHLLSIER